MGDDRSAVALVTSVLHPLARRSAWLRKPLQNVCCPFAAREGLSLSLDQKLVSVRVDAYLKMFTARAATSRMVIDDRADSVSMRNLAQRLSGIASVGLKAIELVKET